MAIRDVGVCQDQSLNNVVVLLAQIKPKKLLFNIFLLYLVTCNLYRYYDPMTVTIAPTILPQAGVWVVVVGWKGRGWRPGCYRGSRSSSRTSHCAGPSRGSHTLCGTLRPLWRIPGQSPGLLKLKIVRKRDKIVRIFFLPLNI